MGSQLVKALIEQRAIQKTNPDGVTPEISNPIFQDAQQINSSFKPIEQKAVRTNLVSGADILQTTHPIEQTGALRISPAEGVLEQRNVETNSQTTKPIEQTQLEGASALLEQRDIKISVDYSNPIEQIDQISNSIDIEQADFIDLIFPPCASIRNPVTTNILVRLNDLGNPFDTATLIFKVNGLEVQDADTFTVTALANGIEIDYDPFQNFEYSSKVEIYLSIYDTASNPNHVVLRCSFFTVADTKGPQILNIVPCNQTAVDELTAVEFDVIDYESGVNPDSIVLNIEGIGVCSDLVLEDLSTVSGTGYHVTWNHLENPFRFSSTVSVGIEVQDLASSPNKSVSVCRFQVTESMPPEFINFNPGECKTFVDNTTGLTFEVYGVEEGVDISTLEVIVDSKNRKVLVSPRIRRVD